VFLAGFASSAVGGLSLGSRAAAGCPCRSNAWPLFQGKLFPELLGRVSLLNPSSKFFNKPALNTVQLNY
jgi:hypothetical protein